MADAVSVDKPKGPSVSYATPVAEQKALAKSGNVEGAIANLLQHEKTARLVCENKSVAACRGTRASLSAHPQTLTGRRFSL